MKFFIFYLDKIDICGYTMVMYHKFTLLRGYMRYKIFIILFMMVTCNLFASDEACSEIIDMINGKSFNEVSLDSIEKPSNYELSVINFILKNTCELNIHRMRDEDENQVFTRGQEEAVFDKNKQLVKNYNKGTYNYFIYSEQPIKHFLGDILPWLKLGISKDDPTSVKERLFYYTLDLNIGIQSYIFSDVKKLSKIDYESLSEQEKAVYKFFKYVLFNKNYKIRLDLKSKKKLKESAEDYWLYFGEIQNLLEVKQ